MSDVANTATPTIIPTILCGGEGARLWPLSRKDHPKQFLPADGSLSFLQSTFLRAAALDGVKDILTVTSKDLFDKVSQEYRAINRSNTSTSYVLEPCSKNTAPAVIAAAYMIQQRYSSDAIMLLLPSDHLVKDQKAFELSVEKGATLASSGRHVTFGIRPTYPATGYGYIEGKGTDVVRFVEKPELSSAQDFLASGNFLWNSGMFCFRVGTLLEEAELYSPNLYAGVIIALHAKQSSEEVEGCVWELPFDQYSQILPDSIDYSIMEKTTIASVVPCDIGWSDVGCWNSYGTLSEEAEEKNYVSGNVIVENSTDCIVHADKRLIGVLGVEGLIIADTPDALLVASRNSSQDVKALYNRLKDLNMNESKHHITENRPWGTYTVLEESSFHKVKRIEVKPGQKLSLQLHEHRSEHWVVLQGKAKVINGEQELILSSQDHTFIPAQCKHRLENIGDELLVVLEVQTGTYLGEDDIIRFDDQYGRVEAA